MSYLKRVYTVSVSTYQMAVLLAYNQADTLPLSALSQHTQLPVDELTNTLHSLTDSKLLIQRGGGAAGSKSQGDEEEMTDFQSAEFQLNMNYSNKRTKFKITAMLQKDSQQVRLFVHV